jgi:hypothetical protein
MSASAVSPLRLAAPALAALFLAAPAAPAQAPGEEPDFPRPVAEDTRVFRRLLDPDWQNLTTLKSFNDLNPKDSILVMLGETRRLGEVPGGLQQFLSQGGAALIASDKPMTESARAQLRQATGYTVTGYTWSHTPGNVLCYRGISYCPLVQWPQVDDTRLMRHPTHPDLPLKVATNMPSLLEPHRPVPAGIVTFAQLPPNSVFNVPEAVTERPANVLGVFGEVGAGRVIVLADHSIFIDEMMKPTDNNNVEFAANCLTYLRGEQNQRTKVLFIHDGTILNEPRPSLLGRGNQLLNQLEEGLNKWEDEDRFNSSFMKVLGDVAHFFKKPLGWVLSMAATVALLVYGCYRLGIVARTRPEAGVPALAAAARGQGPAGSLIERRHDGVLDIQNIWEAGRQLARDAFEAAGVAAPVPYREPVVTVPGAWWWRRSREQARVLRLWRLAFLNRPAPLPPYTALGLAADLEQLKADLRAGTIQLA